MQVVRFRHSRVDVPTGRHIPLQAFRRIIFFHAPKGTQV